MDPVSGHGGGPLAPQERAGRAEHSVEPAALDLLVVHVLPLLSPSDALSLSRTCRSARSTVLASSPAWSSSAPVLVQPSCSLQPALGPLVRLHVCELSCESPEAEQRVLALLTCPAVRSPAIRSVAFAQRSALCTARVLAAVAALDAPLEEVRVAVHRANASDALPAARAAAAIACRHAATLRTLHVGCVRAGGGPDRGGFWDAFRFPVSAAAVGSAVVQGLAEGFAAMQRRCGRGCGPPAPLRSLVLASLLPGDVRVLLDSAPGGALPHLEELVGLRCLHSEPLSLELGAELSRRCPALSRLVPAPAEPGRLRGPCAEPWWPHADASMVHLPYTRLLIDSHAVGVLAAHSGPYPLVQSLVLDTEQRADGVLGRMPEAFPNLTSLEVRRVASYQPLAEAAGRWRHLRRLVSSSDVPEAFRRAFALRGGLRDLAITFGGLYNEWMASVPGLLGGLEALDVQFGPGLAFPGGNIADDAHLAVSSSLRRLTVRVGLVDAALVPRVRVLAAELLRHSTGLEDLVLVCHPRALHTLAAAFADGRAHVPPGCHVSLDLGRAEEAQWHGMDAELERAEVGLLLGRVQALKGNCESLRRVSRLCSGRLRETWVVVQQLARWDVSDVAEAVRLLPGSCTDVRTDSPGVGRRLRSLVGPGRRVLWEMPS
eukprot:m51a1_g1037 hypothetical protein (659) ;mRNA; f:693353-695329